ncbi:hypothetical protein L345_04148, partial [Ophiophagus hannah]
MDRWQWGTFMLQDSLDQENPLYLQHFVQANEMVKSLGVLVAGFVQRLPGCKEQAALFRQEQIDGEAFLLLNQSDIVKILSIKLGPALKIYNAILMFKTAEED